MKPFYIETISFERIFIDKLFAIEFYLDTNKYIEACKHIYDIVLLFKQETIKSFLNNKEQVLKMIKLKRKEESKRIRGIDSSINVIDFKYFKYFKTLKDNLEFEEK